VRILEGAGLTKRFGGLYAVTNVDLHVDEGETVGLIGPNGAGKTTLFNLVSGALRPDAGTITFKGRNITGLSPHLVCRAGIARTFQAVKVFANMPVIDNVRLGALFGKAATAAAGASAAGAASATARAEELLEFVGMSSFRMSTARDLTLVRQKQVEVARALATSPQLLMLDELMAGLNLAEVAQAMDLVRRIRQRGVTVLMIEHVMKAVMGVCDRIVVLHHGEKIAEGTPQEIAANRTVIEVYLGE